MKALLLVGLLLINLQSMTVKEKGVSECILHHIAAFEKGASDFASVRAAHDRPENAQTASQFAVTDSACAAECTFVKESGGNRLGAIYLALQHPTTLAKLGEQFGTFKHLPPTPSKKWSAIAKYNSGSSSQEYAIIASTDRKIEDNTPISLITIRIDYED